MRLFEGFKRKAVIVVCTDEELAKRKSQQDAQDGNDVSEASMLEMQANMALPKVSYWLEDVEYAELNEEEAKELVQKYNKAGKDAGYGPGVQRRDFRDFNRWKPGGHRRNDYGSYRDKSYYGRDYDRGNRSRGGWHQRSYSNSGNWNRYDRRDYRENRDWRDNRSGSSSRYYERDNRNHYGGGGRESNYNRNYQGNRGRNQGGSGWQGSGWNQQDDNWGGRGNSYQGQGGNWSGQGWGGGSSKWNNYGGHGYGSVSNGRR